jgi:uncharacterized SAM-binding protein YcdF (DUF218 family)
MFVAFKSLAHTLLLPPAGPLLLALIAYGLLWSRLRRQATVLLGVALVSLWVVGTPLVSDLLWRLAEGYPTLDLSKPLDAQAIVVIGGEGHRTRAPEYGGKPAVELALLERLTYTSYVAHHTSLPVLVSGAGSEALAMRTSLERDFGVKTRWVEDQSRDTFENAEFSARLLKADGIKRIVLVTSSPHIWRAAHEFMTAGLEVVPAPTGVWAPRKFDGLIEFIPTPRGIMRAYAAVYELVGEPVRIVLSVLHVRRHPG